MATTKNIKIKQFNGTDYDTLLLEPQYHASTHSMNGDDPIDPEDIEALSLANGGTVNGNCTFRGSVLFNNSLILYRGESYGDTLPLSGSDGQIYFMLTST